ncbi:hypothetical protein HN51_021934, partial [Arachis hypogaea]
NRTIPFLVTSSTCHGGNYSDSGRTEGWLCLAVVEDNSISTTSSSRAPLSLSRSRPPSLPWLMMMMASTGTATVSINGSGDDGHSDDDRTPSFLFSVVRFPLEGLRSHSHISRASLLFSAQ